MCRLGLAETTITPSWPLALTGRLRLAGRYAVPGNGAACLRTPIPRRSHASHSRLFARCPHFQVNSVTGKPESRHGPSSESKPPIWSRVNCNLNSSRSRENCNLATSGRQLYTAGALPTRIFLRESKKSAKGLEEWTQIVTAPDSERAGEQAGHPPARAPRGPPGRARRGRRRRPEAPRGVTLRVTMGVTRTEILSAVACTYTFRVSVGL